ncbi:FxLD family lanthipeptide [Actinoplanes sp. ATCC 53533]|uniref:FxLD family lanthipeptide n=1 Tax=Actinoplanes sp. ATCC 53533 TaxID=1288362 RepID=UPI001F1D9319|nr:FxLD family lanthipeptide [Actinoplanes sp. ATCC 53533]
MVPPTALLEAPVTGPDDLTDLFRLDLEVVEETVPVAQLRCTTGDGCGETCSGSACTTSAYDPRD